MPGHTLYAYVDGIIGQSSAEDLEVTLETFVASRKWIVPAVWVVNDPAGHEPDFDQHVGINLELPDPAEEPSGWFNDIEELAVFLSELSGSVGCEFVIGIAEPHAGIAEDLFSIDAKEPNIQQLRQIIGVAT